MGKDQTYFAQDAETLQSKFCRHLRSRNRRQDGILLGRRSRACVVGAENPHPHLLQSLPVYFGTSFIGNQSLHTWNFCTFIWGLWNTRPGHLYNVVCSRIDAYTNFTVRNKTTGILAECCLLKACLSITLHPMFKLFMYVHLSTWRPFRLSASATINTKQERTDVLQYLIQQFLLQQFFIFFLHTLCILLVLLSRLNLSDV